MPKIKANEDFSEDELNTIEFSIEELKREVQQKNWSKARSITEEIDYMLRNPGFL